MDTNETTNNLKKKKKKTTTTKDTAYGSSQRELKENAH